MVSAYKIYSFYSIIIYFGRVYIYTKYVLLTAWYVMFIKYVMKKRIFGINDLCQFSNVNVSNI